LSISSAVARRCQAEINVGKMVYGLYKLLMTVSALPFTVAVSQRRVQSIAQHVAEPIPSSISGAFDRLPIKMAAI